MAAQNPPFKKELLADGRIVAYRFYDTGGASADAWWADMEVVFGEWPAALPIGIMLDLRMSGALVSPRALFRGGAVSRLRPEVKGRSAILITNQMAASIVSQLITGVTEKDELRQRRIFSDENEAMTWLLEMVKGQG